jgi:hypothetical protein
MRPCRMSRWMYCREYGVGRLRFAARARANWVIVSMFALIRAKC